VNARRTTPPLPSRATVVAAIELGQWDATVVLEEALVDQPVDPFDSGELTPTLTFLPTLPVRAQMGKSTWREVGRS